MNELKLERLARIEASQQRIEAKLDRLIAALADEQDDEDKPQRTLDGEPAGQARNEGDTL